MIVIGAGVIGTELVIILINEDMIFFERKKSTEKDKKGFRI